MVGREFFQQSSFNLAFGVTVAGRDSGTCPATEIGTGDVVFLGPEGMASFCLLPPPSLLDVPESMEIQSPHPVGTL
jgi:hypothetical protein